ncbi:aminotransferase class I/II-fold pyridoxal phosphate-dependent enzyme [Planctobacterium marinum]|uniref:8-amino-7-oxononanoate synthase n=1 Tax=Planctobacterium marinum TaxID=1631968 RepID=A0AA48HUB6_9ALTE|nr:8-amino-7-oxononanoate synthase [Planctobacterium marinum]
MPFEHVAEAINARQQQNLLRQPVTVQAVDAARVQIDGNWYLNFSANDYLGMSQHPKVKDALQGSIAAGSGASPVVTGFSQQHQELCNYLCQLTGQESAMLFSSGFAANYAVCKTLMDNSNGLILADRLSHASLIDGSVSAEAPLKRFKHNDMNHLDTLLAANAQQYRDILVVSEGIFSMDGDIAPFGTLLPLVQKHNAWLMLDNAHSIGVLGSEQFKVQMGSESLKPQIVMATFGKAVGTGGAFVAGSTELITYLQNFARHYVYSTAFSAAHAHATLTSLRLIESDLSLREKLRANIETFRGTCCRYDIPVSQSETAIQPVIIGSPESTMAISQGLREQGFWVSGIRYPTVPKHTDRLRITLSALHNKSDIEELVRCLCVALDSAKGERQ